MKILSIIMKIAMLILAAIWGIGCGILFPAVILNMGSEIVPSDIANDHVIIVWLVTSVLGFVVPSILTMCRLYKTASVMSLAGFGGMLYVYARFAQLYAATEDNIGPTELYMPCIFITILIIFITVIENREKIKGYFEKRTAEQEREAPSIFSDNTRK